MAFRKSNIVLLSKAINYGLKICMCFFQIPELFYYSLFFRMFNLGSFSNFDITKVYMYMELVPCECNSPKSF